MWKLHVEYEWDYYKFFSHLQTKGDYFIKINKTDVKLKKKIFYFK